MRLRHIFTAALLLLCFASAAGAANWTTTEGGSTTCTALRQDGTCYLETAGATSATISIQQCPSWTLVVFDAATSVMPQTCTDSACTSSVNVLSTGLTGAAPNVFVTSVAPFNFLRVVTSDSVTVSIKCGR